MKKISSKLFTLVTLLLTCVLLFGILFTNKSAKASADFSEKVENIAEETEEVKPVEEKTYCKATLDDDFADDTVLVVLNREATLKTNMDSKLKLYTKKDFSNIDCESVVELTKSTRQIIDAQIIKEKGNGDLAITNAVKAVGESEDNQINSENYKRILKLKLKNCSKENVLKAIKIL